MRIRLLKNLASTIIIHKKTLWLLGIGGRGRTTNFNPVIGALTLSSSPHQNDHSLAYIENPNFKISKRWHIGHSDHHRDHEDDLLSGKEGERIFRLGLASDVGLAAGKALTGYLSGSTAIIADAAHSVSDVVLSGVALLSFKAARVPKDKEHPYGHGKFETLGALGISAALLATAGGIAWHAVDVLLGFWCAAPEVINQSLAHEHMHGHGQGGHHHGIDMAHPVLALNMTIVSIAVKEGYGGHPSCKYCSSDLAYLYLSSEIKQFPFFLLYWITKRAGERANSRLMKANAWHHRADAVSSVVALIGVGGSILGVRFLDPLAGLVVSGMILKTGLETGYESVLELVDAAIPSQLMEPYRNAILQVEGVKGCNHLRGRRAGSFLYLDVNVEVDPFSSVSAAHDVGENVRRKIQQSHPEIAEVFIHIEPSSSGIPPVHSATEEDGKSNENPSGSLECSDVEDIVSNILSSKFAEKLTVQRITRHMLQGRILLQIEVTMPPDMLIRDAVKVAEEAEKVIFEAVPNNVSISMQLRLAHATPNLHYEWKESDNGSRVTSP
ncbi:metal tolerance protein 2 isoform X1 [Coffea arabica]|uniref:Metal tolerance protein 2 isoform X1 n=1 Tax=Coffea arabica TaxID=13443 RepID=A0A6P6V636_COFAR|nr:metal tolerance protein 2-like isoform X1 [Coffea arabica]